MRNYLMNKHLDDFSYLAEYSTKILEILKNIRKYSKIFENTRPNVVFES
jgi:histidinol phosphatase-like PHP family hydrolase